MDEKISVFIKSLKNQLEGLPEEEILEVSSYYEEYLSDASETGKDLEEVLAQLDSPEEIAKMIKTETSIIRAQRNPGLRNFASVLRNTLKSVTTPLSVLSLSTFVTISYSMVIVLFAAAFLAFLGAVIIGLGMVYQAFTIPSRFVMEIAGTLGMGLFGAGICLLLAYALYRLAKLFIKISIRMIHRMLRKTAKPMPVMDGGRTAVKQRSKKVVFACLIVSLVGLVIFSVSGMPMRFFTIFNSMKPDNITMRTFEVEPQNINKISASTAHSHIKLEKSPSKKILVAYEQPDWLDYEVGESGSMLSFHEKSNGRLPLFKLVSLHESRTGLVISIPDGYRPEAVNVESTGGYVFISGVEGNIDVKTLTGSIYFAPGTSAGNYNIKANTGSGSIVANGVQAVQKTPEGPEYYIDTGAENNIRLRSTAGNININ